MNLYLWQRPKASFKHHACEDDPVWYENAAVGHNSLGEMMTNMSKLARLSRVYTNNCIRGTYVAILDSLVEDYPLVTTLVSMPVSQRYQPILPREPCDERPTMVSVSEKYQLHSPDAMVSSRGSEIQEGHSSPFSVVQSRDKAHLKKIFIDTSNSLSQPISPNNIKTSSSHGNSRSFNEKQTELKPSSPTESSYLAMQYYSTQRGLHSPLAPYRMSQLQGAFSHSQRSPAQSFNTTESEYSLPRTTLSSSSSSLARTGNHHSSYARSRVVYCQTAPTMACSSSHIMHCSAERNSMSGSPLTTHVLDTARGVPARNIQVQLYFEEIRPDSRMWKHIASGVTNGDGRIPNLLTQEQFIPGKYMIRFETEAYFKDTGVSSFFYPYVEIVFHISDPSQHYHVPLLLSPFSYSTYRGS